MDIKKYAEKLFFQWNIVSFVIIMLATEAMVLAIDGHFYNDTMLIYMLPLLLWNIRSKIKATPVTWKQIVGAAGAGVLGMAAFYMWMQSVNQSGGEEINHLLIKAGYVGVGAAVVAFYLIVFLCKNSKEWTQQKTMEKLCLIALCVLLLPGMWVQKEIPLYSITGWVTVLVCFASGMDRECEDKRKRLIVGVLAVIYACCMTFGNMIHISDFFGSTGKKVLLGVAVGIAGWYMLWRQCIYILLEIAGTGECKAASGGSERKRYWSYVGIMFLAWLPYFLGFYPGVLSSDSVSQVQQIIGQLPSSNHHPWIHTQLIGVCYRIGNAILGSANGGVAVYSLVSMLLLALAFAGICMWQYRIGLPKLVRILSIIFLALCPFNGIYSITMWKDIPFTAFVILFMVNIWKLTDECRRGSVNKWDAAAYVILSILVCIFRSNGIYMWIFTLPFLLWQLRKEWKKWGALSAAALLLVMLYKSVLLPSLQVVEPDTIESLSIPAQQIACVITKGGTVSDAAMQELQQVVDITKVAETYQSHTSDPIKKLVRAKDNMEYIAENGGSFLQLYIETGLENPYYYLEAFIEQTKGYWYHKENDWIYHTTFVTDNEIDIYRDGKLPTVVISGMEKLLALCLDGFHVVWSLALFTFAVLLSIAASFINKKSIVMYMPLLGLVLTLLIATPRYGDFRYVYALFAALPLYLGNMVYSFKQTECSEEK